MMKVSLRTKIIGMSLGLCALMALGGFISLQKMMGSYNTTFYDIQENTAKVLANYIADQFFERYGDIQAFALNPTVKKMDAVKIPYYLDEYVKLYGIYDVILVVDKDGNYVGSNTKDVNGKEVNQAKLKEMNFKSAPWFEAAINKKWTSDKSKGFDGTFFEDLHIDPIYQHAFSESQRTGVGFTSLIQDESGQTVGVITNRLNNKWFESSMASIFESRKQDGFADTEVTLLNKDGFVIAELAPKHHENKIEFENDTEKVILKENFYKNHFPAGDKIATSERGAIVSRDQRDPASDLVGYASINGSKFIDSIGWKTVIHMDSAEAFSAETEALNSYILYTVVFSVLCLLFAVYFGWTTAKSIGNIILTLNANSKKLADSSSAIASQSTEISEASTEQAAALQETVAAVDEINAMVEKNADAAQKSKEMSAQSRESANRGRQTVENMLHAVNDIDAQNNEISNQMQQTNTQLSAITKLINDIGSKTKVINEIVFQTKLLSFNASVEAARAGEYGKGFAVVAEEVGNLAQMSGSAAKEITEMLEQSVRQVETIIGETKSKVDRLMSESHKKIEIGTQTAKECSQALEDILNQISSVDSLVSEIAVASKEQSVGVSEISKAMGQMEEVTQQNTSVSQSASSSAEDLRSQSLQLDKLVQGLVFIVNGTRDENYLDNSSQKEDSQHNVVAFENKSRGVQSESKKKSPEVEPHSFQRASGADEIPMANDPGFDE